MNFGNVDLKLPV